MMDWLLYWPPTPLEFTIAIVLAGAAGWGFGRADERRSVTRGLRVLAERNQLTRKLDTRTGFLVARCLECGIPWPTYTRADLRLMDHAQELRPGVRIPCPGSGRTLDPNAYGEIDDPRFTPPTLRPSRH
jgi:hypothetical protein